MDNSPKPTAPAPAPAPVAPSPPEALEAARAALTPAQVDALSARGVDYRKLWALVQLIVQALLDSGVLDAPPAPPPQPPPRAAGVPLK